MRFNKKILRLAPAFLYFIVIWYMSTRHVPIDITKCDKLIHVVEYAIMGFLVSFGFDINNNNFIKIGKYCFLLAIFTGAADEIHQCFVPWRSGSWYDLLADAIGCAIGMLVWLGLINIINRSKSNGTVYKNISD